MEYPANKGKENGCCNRSSCLGEGAIWYNHGSYSWYCTGCMTWIYDDWAKANWIKDFPNVMHPMFETREMMDIRTGKENTSVHTM